MNTTINTDYVSSWKSQGLSAESIKPPIIGTKTRIKFTGNCLKQSKISYTNQKVVNLFIIY